MLVRLPRGARAAARLVATSSARQTLGLAPRLILVDANAWVDHLRERDGRLVSFLLAQRVHTCDVVVGELRLGVGLPATFARDLLALPFLPSPTAAETRTFIERHQRAFGGSGLGWADVQILLTAAKAGVRVHTSDRAVQRLCASVSVPLA